MQPQTKPIQLFIKSPSISYHTIVKPDATIGEIKVQIESKLGIAVQQQRLIFDGIQLEDKRDLEHYKILNDNTLILQIIDQQTVNETIHNKHNEYLTYGFVKSYFDQDIPKSIICLFMDYLQYLVEKWDINTVSPKVEINGNIIKGKVGIDNFEKVYGSLDLKKYNKGTVIWKLQILNVKWKSIGAYAYIGIDKYDYCGYSGSHKSMGSSSYHDLRRYLMCAFPYGGHLKIGDIIQVCYDLEKLQISFIVNHKDLGVAYKDIKLPSIKLTVSVRYPETQIQLLGVDLK